MPIYENINTGKKVEVPNKTIMSKAYRLVSDKKLTESKADKADKADKKLTESKADK